MPEPSEQLAKAAQLIEEMRLRGKYLLDPKFKFTPSNSTDITKTFKQAKRQMRAPNAS